MSDSRSIAYVPHGPLAQYVELLWLIEGGATNTNTELLIPSVSFEVVLALHDTPFVMFDLDCTTVSATIDGAIVSGLRLKPAIIKPQSVQCYMGIHFRPGGASPVLQVDADEMMGQHVSMRDVCGPEVDVLREMLFHAGTDAERFTILESYLLQRLMRGCQQHHPGIAFALRAFRRSEDRNSVATVAEGIGWSSRHFLNQFAKRVGMTPKRYCRLRRLKHALEMRSAGTSDWVRIALMAGYTDQSHLSNEFRQLVGRTPSDYAKLASRNPHHLILAD